MSDTQISLRQARQYALKIGEDIEHTLTEERIKACGGRRAEIIESDLYVMAITPCCQDKIILTGDSGLGLACTVCGRLYELVYEV